MEEESFIGAFGDMPEDLAGDYGQLYIFRAEDFGAWYRRVRIAHDREVDGGVDAMTDAELAEHGLVRLPTDADMVTIELPQSADGKIWTGREECFWIEARGGAWSRHSLLSLDIIDGSRWYVRDTGGIEYEAGAAWFERPDSWERIADDIETVVPINDEDDERLRHELADRIRRLAAKEEQK